MIFLVYEEPLGETGLIPEYIPVAFLNFNKKYLIWTYGI